MRPRRWLAILPSLLVAGAMAAWAVPGSAAVLAPAAPGQAGARQATAHQATAHQATAHRATAHGTTVHQTTVHVTARRQGQTCDPTASLRPSGPPRVTPGSTMAKIRARGYLIAGVDQSTFHFGFLNPLDGKIEGFDIDMVHAIAKAIFGNPNKVEFRAITDAQRIPEVRSGAVDIVAHTMTINCARLQQVDFSTVYYDAGQRVLVQTNSPVKSIADLRGKKVCATTGSTSIVNIKAAHAIPVAVSYWTDCLVLLQQDDVAAISTDDSILAGLAAQDPWTKIVGPRFTSEPYGLAISQQHPDLVRFVNAVLQQMRTDGQWAASYRHWVGTPVPAPPVAHYTS